MFIINPIETKLKIKIYKDILLITQKMRLKININLKGSKKKKDKRNKEQMGHIDIFHKYFTHFKTVVF